MDFSDGSRSTCGPAAQFSGTTEPGADPGLLLTPASVEVNENGGTATYTVKLATAPTADVTVTLSSGDTDAATVEPASLTFTTTNWGAEQTVTVTGVDDDVVNTGGKRETTITHSASSSDTDYNTLSASLAVAILDVNGAPTFSGDTTADFAENGTGAALTVTAADPDGEDSATAIAYAIKSGKDGDQFDIDASTGALTFKTAPNYEDPKDSDTNNTYVVDVEATGGTGDRAMTATQEVTITVTDATEAPGKPAAPTVATAGSGELAVSWKAPGNTGPAISGYKLRYGTDGATWTEVTPSPATSTSHTLTGLTDGTEYQVQVRATSDEGDGAWSATATATPVGPAQPPAAPTQLALIVESDYLEVDWVAAEGATSHEIAYVEGTPETPNFTNWRTTRDDNFDWVDGLTEGQAYTIGVRGVNDAGPGVVATITGTPTSPPGDITDLTATAGDGQLEMSWTAAARATKHQIRYGTSSGAGTWMDTTSETSHTITGLTNGTKYYIRVRGINAATGVGLSDEITATPNAADGNSLAREALKKALTGQARSLLEEASDVIGRRLSATDDASAPLTAFANLFGAHSPGDCSMEDSLGECATRAFGEDRAGLAGAGIGFDRDAENNRDWFGDFGDLRERIRAQGFAMALNGFTADDAGPGDGMMLTLWGGGSTVSGNGPGNLFWGLDAGMDDRWMAGLAFSGSDASSVWQASRGSTHASGFVESEVSAVYPYARGRFGDGLQLWSLGGFGTGRFASHWSDASTPDAVARLAGDLGFSMGLVGAEQALYEAGGLSLTALGDAGWSRLAATGDEEMDVLVHRTRVGLEGRHASEDGTLTSFFRTSARLDGGEEAAQGVEFAGKLSHVSGRWETGPEGRWYAADADLTGLPEQGVRAVLALRPQADGSGLGLTLSPGWGTATVGEEGLLDAFAGADNTFVGAPALRLDGQVSRGERIGQHVLSPYAKFSFDEALSRHLRGGLALEGPVQTSLAVERRENAIGPVEHGIMLRLDTRF